MSVAETININTYIPIRTQKHTCVCCEWGETCALSQSIREGRMPMYKRYMNASRAQRQMHTVCTLFINILYLHTFIGQRACAGVCQCAGRSHATRRINDRLRLLSFTSQLRSVRNMMTSRFACRTRAVFIKLLCYAMRMLQGAAVGGSVPRWSRVCGTNVADRRSTIRSTYEPVSITMRAQIIFFVDVSGSIFYECTCWCLFIDM